MIRIAVNSILALFANDAPDALGGAPQQGNHNSWAEKASVEELLQKVRADERWIWNAKSILIETEGGWKQTEAGIQHRIAEHKAQFPDINLDDPEERKKDQDFWPELKETMLWAWDDRRIAEHEYREEISSILRIYDGTRALFHDHYLIHQREHYALASSAAQFMNMGGGSPVSSFAAGRITIPDTWWNQVRSERSFNDHEMPADRFEDLGIKKRDLRLYRVLRSWEPRKQELWIDTATGRLNYLRSMNLPLPFDLQIWESLISALIADPVESKATIDRLHDQARNDSGFLEKIFNQFKETNRRPLAEEMPTNRDKRGVLNWLENLQAAKLIDDASGELREEVFQRIDQGYRPREEIIKFMGQKLVPRVEYRLQDWREVKPGRFFPFSQGHSIWITEGEFAGQLGSDSTVLITNMAVDEPLPEELFKMEFREGVQVHDWGHDPPLHYKHKANFSKEEWNEIVSKAEKEKRDKEDRRNEEQALVGKPAPPISAESWLNSGPLDLDNFKGKVVIIDFFAEWCVPCQRDYPLLSCLHAKSDKDKLAIIGVTTPGTPEEKLKELLKKYELEYPIALDNSNPNSKSWGETFAAYRIDVIPHAVLIGRDGRILIHGKLSEVINKVNQLNNS